MLEPLSTHAALWQRGVLVHVSTLGSHGTLVSLNSAFAARQRMVTRDGAN